jgi:hypothetical protein
MQGLESNMIQVEVRAMDGPKKGIWQFHSKFESWAKPAAYLQAFVMWMMLHGLYNVRVTEAGTTIWYDGFWYV